jgi:hypothetical protein
MSLSHLQHRQAQRPVCLSILHFRKKRWFIKLCISRLCPECTYNAYYRMRQLSRLCLQSKLLRSSCLRGQAELTTFIRVYERCAKELASLSTYTSRAKYRVVVGVVLQDACILTAYNRRLKEDKLPRALLVHINAFWTEPIS